MPVSVRTSAVFLCLLGAVLLQAGWLPAARAQAPEAVPAVCHNMPLPSSLPFALDTYEQRLGAFLRAECYRRLNWTHDVSVRDTGPWIAQLTPGSGSDTTYHWIANNYGLHGTVFLYYSPDVYRWMQERDAALREHRDLTTLRPIADGAMILKLMLGGNGGTAADFPDIHTLPKAPIALMVKDATGSKDGWFWGVWDPDTPEKQQLDWPPPPNFPFPWMEAGNYCVNCHASAISEFTFSAPSHVVGDPEKFPTFMITGSPPTIQPGTPPAPDTRTAASVSASPVTPQMRPLSRRSVPRSLRRWSTFLPIRRCICRRRPTTTWSPVPMAQGSS
jgi:hypothetical protein